uniref:Uncharacterized protein n=1 Tax=Prevotella sp. GTC17262 TaxID=3236797 RepID=A0AB33JIA1_9BACT
MKTQNNNYTQQPLTIKAGSYEISVTPDTLRAIADAKEVSAIIYRRLDQLNATFIELGEGGTREFSPEESLHILSDLLLIRERITAIASIDISQDGKPVQSE